MTTHGSKRDGSQQHAQETATVSAHVGNLREAHETQNEGHAAEMLAWGLRPSLLVSMGLPAAQADPTVDWPVAKLTPNAITIVLEGFHTPRPMAVSMLRSSSVRMLTDMALPMHCPNWRGVMPTSDAAAS